MFGLWWHPERDVAFSSITHRHIHTPSSHSLIMARFSCFVQELWEPKRYREDQWGNGGKEWEENLQKRTFSLKMGYFLIFILKSFQTYRKVLFTEKYRNSCNPPHLLIIFYLSIHLSYILFSELVESKLQIWCPFISKDLSVNSQEENGHFLLWHQYDQIRKLFWYNTST